MDRFIAQLGSCLMQIPVLFVNKIVRLRRLAWRLPFPVSFEHYIQVLNPVLVVAIPLVNQ